MKNAAFAYQGAKIQTANPAELTLMLYDGAIKFCNIALLAIENGNVSKANENMIKAQRIINRLRETLDHKYPIAKDFDKVYIYINEKLVEANIHKDVETLEHALKQIRVMRDTWKEVMEKTRRGV